MTSAGVAVIALGAIASVAGIGAPLAIKFGYVVSLLFGAVWLAERASRPGTNLRRAALAVALVVAVMAALCASVLALAPMQSRLDLVVGHSWASCPWHVAELSAPAFVAVVWAMRGLAPTRPRAAGFAAGLLAGTLGAVGYALHCPELSPVFVLVWYTLGILIPAGVGAVLGPWLLRW